MQGIYRVSAVLSLLSCIGSACVVYSYIYFKDLRKHPTIMVVFLCICEFLYSLKFVFVGFSETLLGLQYSPPHGPGWCLVGAMWGQFWGMASISWNAMISLNVVMNLRNPFRSTTPILKVYHIWVWSISFITTVILSSNKDSLGPNGEGTCGVAKAHDPLRLLFYFPLLCYFMLGFFCLALSLKSLTDLQNPKLFQTSQRRTLMGRMILVVLVFTLCWSGPIIHRGYELWKGKTIDRDDGGAFWYIDVGSLSIKGFINALVWFTNPDFVSEMKKKWQEIKTKRKTEKRKSAKVNDTEANIESVVLLPSHEFPTLDSMRRKDIISCLLRGIQDSALGRTQDASKFINSEEFPELMNLDDPNTESVAEYRFFDYQPTVFARFRCLDGISSPEYLRSLNIGQFMKGVSLKVSEGKSGSFFCFSPDRKFIIKTVYPHEATFLNSIISSLHKYFSTESNSFIAKFYGFHGVQVPLGNIIHMVVMANVLDSHLKINEIFDLKGSWINRTNKGRKAKRIGLDQDFDRKLKLTDTIKFLYLDQIAKDSRFLASLGVMDYSLLLGVHIFSPETHHKYHSEKGWRYGVLSREEDEMYFMGIIDMLQYFGWKKKIEYYYKTKLLLRDEKLVSCIPPSLYSQRFIKAMGEILDKLAATQKQSRE